MQECPLLLSLLPCVPCSMTMDAYSYERSKPLGRESYKEMYLFIYR